MEVSNFAGIFHDGLLMQVNVGFWSGARILRPEDLGLKEEDVAEAYKLGRKMLIPQEIIHNFRHIEGQARNLVAKNSFPFPMGNARFVPRKCFKGVSDQLSDLKSQYMFLAEDLITKYDEYRQQMLPVYQEAAERAFMIKKGLLSPTLNTNTAPVEAPSLEFGATDDPDRKLAEFEAEKAEFVRTFLERINSYYPPASSLKAKFSLDWSIYEIAVPTMNLAEGEDIIQREEANQEIRKQMNAKIGGFVEDVVKVLRQETVEVCGRIAKSIQEGKVIRSSTIDSLKTFIDRFKNMNFVGDQTVADQLEAVRREFLDINPDTFKEDLDLKIELGNRLEEIVKVADNLTEQDLGSVTGQYVRSVNWQ
jgi:hypothetical protein